MFVLYYKPYFNITVKCSLFDLDFTVRERKKKNFNFLETQNVFILIERNVTHNTNNKEALSLQAPAEEVIWALRIT